MSSGSHRGVKLLEHVMKIVERVLEKQMQTLINLNKMQFRFVPTKGTLRAVFIARKMQIEYQVKEKELYVCFVDMKQAFDGIP